MNTLLVDLVFSSTFFPNSHEIVVVVVVLINEW